MGVSVSGAIFVLKGDDELVEMRQEGYLLEAHLQDLLAKYPSLLAGDGVNPTAPRRWLLVRKEAGLADREDGGARWALDHLFLDQDAVPTLVEVKRSTDTRIRREVVGQMLDYAANAVVYLPIEQLQAWFDERCRRRAAPRPRSGRGLRIRGGARRLLARGEDQSPGRADPPRVRRRRDPARAPADRRVPQRPDGSRPRSWRSRSPSTWAVTAAATT